MMMVRLVVVRVLVGDARLGIERSRYVGHGRTQPLDQIFEHVVAANAKLSIPDLDIGVPVAEMPGEPYQLQRRCGSKLEQRLRETGDTDDAAVVEHQAVAVAQQNGMRQIKQEFGASLAGQHHAPEVPAVGIEHHAIDLAGRLPLSRRLDMRRAPHGLVAIL
jgi:hypothetical protein